MTFISDRLLQSSKKSYGMYAMALDPKYQARELIHLELGKPAYDTPEHIKQATQASLNSGNVHYSDFRGIPELRQAVAQKLCADNKLQVTEEEVLITNGLTMASFAAIMATINPGDEVILLEPYYPQHVGKIELAGGKVVTVALDAEDNFSIRGDWLAQAVTDKTKAIVLVNPCNPTGRVYSLEELEALAAVAKENDLLVISDEVYEQIVFDENKHISIASLPGMAERTISMFAFTKAYAMDGWRLGYMTAPKSLMQALITISSSAVTHVTTFIQAGGVAALTGPSKPLEDMITADLEKRNLVVSRLNNMKNVTCRTPQGSIYAFPDISATDTPAQKLAESILNSTGVVVESGSFYGANCSAYLRVCFGSESIENLTVAMDKLESFFNSYDPAK